MARTPHPEYHFTSGNFVRDMVIGMSDGLTVPFALAAGLSGAVSNTRLIVIGGLAEIAAGSIAMGLGGYLAARGDAEHYEQERAREYREVEEIPEQEKAEVSYVFQEYGLTAEQSKPIVDALKQTHRRVGGFHDALRTWVGSARSEAGGNQRVHHRRSIYCRRTDSAFAVYHTGQCFSGTHSFGDCDPGGIGYLWIH